MKRIKLYPGPHLELRIHMSDEMAKDYKECKAITESSGFENAKDCDTCSWKNIKIGATSMCELTEIESQLEGLP